MDFQLFGLLLFDTDPDGKKVYRIHGTWSNSKTWKTSNYISHATNVAFKDKNLAETSIEWSGGNSKEARTEAATNLVTNLGERGGDSSEPITLVGHSHGGNVSIEAINLMVEDPKFDNVEINLMTINTPVRDDYQLSDKASKRVTHVNVYDPKDPVQSNGGKSKFGEIGNAGRTFKGATNVKVNNPQDWKNDYHNSHNRVRDWLNTLKNAIDEAKKK